MEYWNVQVPEYRFDQFEQIEQFELFELFERFKQFEPIIFPEPIILSLYFYAESGILLLLITGEKIEEGW